jgi:hypothetical protein
MFSGKPKLSLEPEAIGQPFDRPALVRLLTNVLHVGEVKHKGKVYTGEQPAIVDRKQLRPPRRGDCRLASRACILNASSRPASVLMQ